MHIEVWADLTCPWCFLGRHRLNQALASWEAESGERPEVVWRPYQVDPTAPHLAEPRDEQQARAFADLHSPDRLDAYLAELAEAEGEGFAWRPRWRVNTFEAHRLELLAREQGGPQLQDAVKHELLRAHFVRGENLGDRAVLVAAAETAGFDRAAEALTSGHGGAQVRAELAQAAIAGITAAPSVVVGRRALAGAQEPRAILDFLREAAADPAASMPLPAARRAAGVPMATLAEDPVAAFREAERLLGAREPLEALRVLEVMPEEYRRESAVLQLTARCYFASAQLRRAEAVLERLVEADPSDDYARFVLGRCLLRQSRTEEARAQLRIAVALNPDPDYTSALAEAQA